MDNTNVDLPTLWAQTLSATTWLSTVSRGMAGFISYSISVQFTVYSKLVLVLLFRSFFQCCQWNLTFTVHIHIFKYYWSDIEQWFIWRSFKQYYLESALNVKWEKHSMQSLLLCYYYRKQCAFCPWLWVQLKLIVFWWLCYVTVGPEKVAIFGNEKTEVNSKVELVCSASSVPPATFSWLVNGSEKETKSSFIIEKTTLTDTGNYTCVARNDVTELNSSAFHFLTVAGERVMVFTVITWILYII